MANFRSLSRYARRSIERNRSDEDFIKLRTPLNLEEDEGDIFVTLNDELLQRPDTISFRAYGTTEFWWVIYEFNGINDPLFDLSLGQVLRLPKLERIQDALSKVR